jgi:hypothetical protein
MPMRAVAPSTVGSIEIPSYSGRIAVGLVLLAAFTAPCTGIKLSSGGAPADVFIVLSLGIAGLMATFGNLRFRLPSWPILPCLAIGLCVLVRQIDPAPTYIRVLRMQVYGHSPDDIMKALFWIFALVFVPAAVVACRAIERRSTVWIMASFVAGSALSSLVAVTDFIGVTPNIGRALGDATQICTYRCFNAGLGARMNGLTDHPNTLGMTATLSIPIAMYFVSTMRRKWIAVIAIIALFGGILVSGSRGAQAAAPFCALAGLLIMPRGPSQGRHTRTISVLAAVLGGLVVLMAMPSHARQGILRIFDTSKDALGSDSERAELLRSAIQDWHSYPVFGAGISHIVEAHNIYLQFLASGGVVLAMAMLVYFFVVLRESWTLARQGVVLARFLMLSVVTWLVLGLVFNAVTDRYLFYTIGCIAALAWASANEPGEGTKPRPLAAHLRAE